MKTYFLIPVPFSNVGSGGTDCTTFAPVESVKPPAVRDRHGATLLATSEHLDDGTVRIASRMLNSANRTSRMIDDLLDLTRTRFGDPTPVVREPMDLDPLCRQVVAELEELRSAGALEYTSTGGIHGEWDHDRVAQLLSNLVRNAIQQGAETDAIKITATGHAD